MGITKIMAEHEMVILELLGLNYGGLRWCEFGNQGMYTKEVAKKVYENRGVEHTSMDLNGRNGSLIIDLGKPAPLNLVNYFDVVTNYGTIEHVNNQYEAFKNAHDLCKVGGIMIHGFPLVGNWMKHSRYLYSEKFAQELGKTCGYSVVDYTIFDKGYYLRPRNLLCITYLKKRDDEFIARERFTQIEGLIDSGDLTKTGNYVTKER